MLRSIPLSTLVLFLVAALPRAGSAQERDEWHKITGDMAGFSHTVVEKVERDGRVLLKTTNDQAIAMNRFGQSLEINVSASVLEDDAGNVIEIHQEFTAAGSGSVTDVKVSGDKADVTRRTAGPAQVETIDWKKEWLGEVAKTRLIERKIAEGATEFSYPQWTAEGGETVATVKVLGKNKVEVPGTVKEPGTGMRELLQLRTTVDTQPGAVTDDYYGEDRQVVVSISKMMGMNIVSAVSTKAACIDATKAPTPEIFGKVSPKSNVRLPRPYQMDELVLSIAASDPELPLPKLETERQTVLDRKSDRELDLRIRRIVPAEKHALPLSNFTEVEKECLAPNLQIECADPGIVALATKAVGDEKEAWAAACKLEKFANEYIADKNYGKAFLTAKQVMDERSGDCTEHGVFLAALCRAAGIPSRVSIGLLYFKGIWGGHMWTEISLAGKWYALDAVLGNGGVGGSHLALASDSLKSSQIEKVFANVMLGMTMKMDVLSYRHGEKQVLIGGDSATFAIEDRVYRHLLYGISLEAPEEYEIRPSEKMEMGEEKILVLDAQNEPDIEVSVADVDFEFDLAKVKEALAAQGITRLKAEDRTIDGRPGKVFRGKKKNQEIVVGAVLDDATLVMVSAGLGEGQDDRTLVEVLDSLDLDG